MFTIVQTGRDGSFKELATTPYADIAAACALGIANRLHPGDASHYRHEGDPAHIAVRDEEGNTQGYVVLKRDQPRWIFYTGEIRDEPD